VPPQLVAPRSGIFKPRPAGFLRLRAPARRLDVGFLRASRSGRWPRAVPGMPRDRLAR